MISWFRKAVKEFKNWFDRFVKNRIRLDKEEHATIYYIVLITFIACLIIIFCGAIYGSVCLISWAFSGDKTDPSIPETPSPPSENECKKFDLVEWQTGQGQLIQENNIWSVAPGSRKGLLRYPKSISLSSEIEVVFMPHSEEQINFVLLVHDLYEVVVGDGGYQGTNLKIWDGQKWKIINNTEDYPRNIFEKGELSPGNVITIVLEQDISRLEDNSYEVNISILYSPRIEGEDDKLFATYDFPLPPEFKYKEETARLSMGLLAANNGTKVSAEFLCFKVSKILLGQEGI